jgi:hypothetical protein
MTSLFKALVAALLPALLVLGVFVGAFGYDDAVLWLAAIGVAALAALWQSIIFRLTGNRVVSVLSGLMAVLHPWVLGRCGSVGALSEITASVLVLSALRLGLRSNERTQRWPHLIISWTLMGLAAWLEALALVMPVLFTLLRRTFFRDVRAQGYRAAAPMELSFGAGSALAAVGLGLAFSRSDLSLSEHLRQSPVADDVAAVLLGMRHGPGLPLAGSGGVLLAGLFALGVGVFALARMRSRVQPSWLLRHTAFALLWLSILALCSLAAGHLAVLALMGPGFLLPALAWRVVLASPWGGSSSEVPQLAPPPTVFLPQVPTPAPRPRQTNSVSAPAPASQDALPSIAAVRARVDAAVSAAVESSVATLLSEVQGSSRLRTAPQQGAAKGAKRPAGTALALAAIAETDTRSAREDAVFQSIIAPHLAADVRALEIESSRYSSAILAATGRYVCVGSTPLRLERARRAVGADARALFVLGGREPCAALPDDDHDFVFGAEALVVRDTVGALQLLLGLGRVLRAGGVAILGFANVNDALGRGLLLAAARGHGPVHQWTSTEILRVLAKESGFSVEGVHLCADGQTSFVLLRRSLRQEALTHG